VSQSPATFDAFVPEQTVEAPPLHAPVTAPPAAGRRRASATELGARYPWALAGIGLLVVSTALVLWAGTRPGYDPYGWLVWGKLTVHWKLDTNGAPSWKPLPFLFTVPYAVVGHYALWLWMVTSVAISLSGAIFAWRIAFRLTEAAPERRYAAYAAGAFAAVSLLGIRDYSHFILSSQSDTMIVSLCLAAIDCHLSGRRRWAFWLWVLAALGRPEAWPFLALYSLWAWRAIPSMKRMILAGLVLIPLFWFGIPAVTANSWFVAGNNALHSPRELHQSKVYGTVDRFLDLHETAVWIAALLAVGLAVRRRQRFTLLLAAGALTWLVVEIAFVIHGWPGVPRYLFEPVGVVCVLAGIFVGRLILDLPPLLARIAPRLSPRKPAPRFATQLGNWGAILVLAVVVGAMLPAARARLKVERHDLTHERARAMEFNRLSTVVKRLGTARILACGQPNIPIGYQSVLAWYLGVKIGALYVSQAYERLHPHPLVNMYPLPNGWRVFPSHVGAASRARCRGLHLVFKS
jgi:hypothetical protein